jgi:hypothetical protein
MCYQDISDPFICYYCTELKNHLHSALTELKSLQEINRLLFKELEIATTKTEVMSGAVTNQMADESQNYWCISNRKKCNNQGYRNSRRNNIAEHLLTSSTSIPINNRFDVLSNLTDDPTSVQDAISVIQNDSLIKRNQKFHSNTVQPLDSHVINHCTGEIRKTNYVRHESVNDHEDTNIPKNIPTIINGCVSPLKNEKSFFHNHAKGLYDKLINAKNNISKSTKHKILLIGDSHLRGYPEMMKSKLNSQFNISGFT